MQPVTEAGELVETLDARVFSAHVQGHEITWAIDTSGHVYLNGDLHPEGSAGAMRRAHAAGIEWVQLGAVLAYFPVAWLVAECMGDTDRLTIIDGLLRMIRRMVS